MKIVLLALRVISMCPRFNGISLLSHCELARESSLLPLPFKHLLCWLKVVFVRPTWENISRDIRAWHSWVCSITKSVCGLARHRAMNRIISGWVESRLKHSPCHLNWYLHASEV